MTANTKYNYIAKSVFLPLLYQREKCLILTSFPGSLPLTVQNGSLSESLSIFMEWSYVKLVHRPPSPVSLLWKMYFESDSPWLRSEKKGLVKIQMYQFLCVATCYGLWRKSRICIYLIFSLPWSWNARGKWYVLRHARLSGECHNNKLSLNNGDYFLASWWSSFRWRYWTEEFIATKIPGVKNNRLCHWYRSESVWLSKKNSQKHPDMVPIK